ncbi:MAG: hypothetical protein ACU843_12875 [Gammaproteobacteria bacterium]
MREERATDFFIELPEVGNFRFGRKTFGDKLKIQQKIVEMIGPSIASIERDDSGEPTNISVDPMDTDVRLFAGMMAEYHVMCVSAPDGWENIEDVDVTDPDLESKVFDLFSLWRAKEKSFRKDFKKAG